MIKVVLFDLDGTLLPMDQDVFIKNYFGMLAKHLAPHGYQPEKLIGAVVKGTEAMILNNGKITNEQAFWQLFEGVYGVGSRKDEGLFARFYEEQFDKIKLVCGFNEMALKAVQTVKRRGFRVALATNPIFPAVATHKRIKWAGLTPECFELITTYENSSYCKPNPKYYFEILKELNVLAEECVMVGNDVGDDMVAASLGMKVFLLTDCLINKSEEDICNYPNGGFNELIAFIENLNKQLP
ncbi:MAG: HAD family hydrolase [Clostridia bacterium]|nr:HAD family hydrolase [Clostridia bacterium]